MQLHPSLEGTATREKLLQVVLVELQAVETTTQLRAETIQTYTSELVLMEIVRLCYQTKNL